MVNVWTFKPLHIIFSTPVKCTGRDFWSSRNERKPLSKLQHVFRTCSGVSLKQWKLALSNLCHCVQHPWKRTSRDFWSSMNERKPLSKLKQVFRACSGESHKWWMFELSNLCHCVQHHCKLTGRDFLNSRNERKPLSKPKHVLRKCCGVCSETVNARAFKLLPLCSAPLKT